MFLDFLIRIFEQNEGREAIIWQDTIFTYRNLLDKFHYWEEEISAQGIESGSIAVVDADFSPTSIALMLALFGKGCIFFPLTRSVRSQKDEFIEIGQGEIKFCINEKDEVTISHLPYRADHELYNTLRNEKHPGLVFFSSASTGKSKASVHDVTKLLDKFRVPRYSLRTITFLLYDHIGGLNTLLYTLSNAGVLVTTNERSPDGVLKAVEKHRVELLPVSPTFINLILLSEAYKRYDIGSLKTVTYGTEPMPESTLKRFNMLFPTIKMIQTYGLSEVGILRSQSKSSDSLWVKVGGEGFETRVVNGMLEIKAASAMLGYLNAPSPFTKDGWFNTGDAVVVEGEYIKILGRKSEIINVGGEKVYPQEVENTILEMDNVAEVTVYGERNPITGSIVCAKVTLIHEEEKQSFSTRLREYCSPRLLRYKIPIKIDILNIKQYSDRFKKIRYHS